MKNLLKAHRFSFILALVGAICGFLYWRFVGCSSGTCPITSHWYTMGIYGAIMGYLIGDLISSIAKKKDKSEADS